MFDSDPAWEWWELRTRSWEGLFLCLRPFLGRLCPERCCPIDQNRQKINYFLQFCLLEAPTNAQAYPPAMYSFGATLTLSWTPAFLTHRVAICAPGHDVHEALGREAAVAAFTILHHPCGPCGINWIEFLLLPEAQWDQRDSCRWEQKARWNKGGQSDECQARKHPFARAPYLVALDLDLIFFTLNFPLAQRLESLRHGRWLYWGDPWRQQEQKRKRA